MAAISTEHIAGASPAVEKQNRLLFFLQSVPQASLQGLTENRAVAGFQFLPHINYIHRWQAGHLQITIQILEAGSFWQLPGLIELYLNRTPVSQDALWK